jgi:hypothetical protein
MKKEFNMKEKKPKRKTGFAIGTVPKIMKKKEISQMAKEKI